MNERLAPKIRPYFRRHGRKRVQEGYRVEWYEGGKRRRKKFPTLESAQLFYEEKRRNFALQNTKLNLVPTRLTAEHIKFVEQALGILEKEDFLRVDDPSTTAALVKAVEWFVANYRDPVAGMPTVKAFIAVFLEAKKSKADGTYRDYKKNLAAFLKAGYGDHRIDMVTTAMIAKFLKDCGVGPTTKAKYFGALRALFYFAMQKSEFVETPWLDHNPALDLHQRPTPSVPRRHRYTLAEVKDLIQVSIYLRCAPLVVLRLFTMLRTEEAERFIKGPPPPPKKPGRPRAAAAYNPWAYIDLEQKTLAYHESDSAKDSRDITLYPVVIAWLKFFREHRIPLQILKREVDARRIAVPTKFGADYTNLIRHTAISFRATYCDSLLETAVEADNSEKVIKRHYFRKVSKPDAEEAHALTPNKFDLRPYLDPHFVPNEVERRELEKRFPGISSEIKISRRNRTRGQEQFR